MTLIVAATSPESIWMLADRRLSSCGRAPDDTGIKLMCLEATDGLGILGYTGLGRTSAGMEPSEWMGNVLRGRKLSLEASVLVIAEAVRRQFPKHLTRPPGQPTLEHRITVPAFLGDEPRLYEIILEASADGEGCSPKCLRHQMPHGGASRVLVCGSGAPRLQRDTSWCRELIRFIRHCDDGRISSRRVADYLACLNMQVSNKVDSVGPQCIVVWRNRRDGAHHSGGGHQFYTGVDRDATSVSLPTIGGSLPIHEIVKVLFPHIRKAAEPFLRGEEEKLRDLDHDAITEELDKIRTEPDETLE